MALANVGYARVSTLDRVKDALDFAARPNRLPWPPMILAAAVAGAVLAGRLVPRARIARGVGPVRAAGAVALAAGACGRTVRPRCW